MKFQFKPQIQYFPLNDLKFDEKDFIDERSIYGGSIDWTIDNSDKITQKVLLRLLDSTDFYQNVIHQAHLGYHPVIDTRITMMINENFAPVDLMGEELEMYQAIAGWHCDGVPRKDRGSQPDLDKLGEPIHHYVLTLSSTDEQVSATGLIDDDLELDIEGDKMVWDQVNTQVSNKIKNKDLTKIDLDDGVFVKFNRQTIHCSQPSKVRGWRYFFRCSFYHMPAMNQFRTNNNVYLVPKGW